MNHDDSEHLTFWNVGAQQVCVDFDGGRARIVGVEAEIAPMTVPA